MNGQGTSQVSEWVCPKVGSSRKWAVCNSASLLSTYRRQPPGQSQEWHSQPGKYLSRTKQKIEIRAKHNQRIATKKTTTQRTGRDSFIGGSGHGSGKVYTNIFPTTRTHSRGEVLLSPLLRLAAFFLLNERGLAGANSEGGTEESPNVPFEIFYLELPPVQLAQLRHHRGDYKCDRRDVKK